MINEMPLKVLQNVYKGSDIYVLGSGKSMDFYDASFFKHRVTIGLNDVSLKIPTQYTVAKDFNLEQLNRICETGSLPIVSRGKYGHEFDRQVFDTPHPYFMFTHKQNNHITIDYSVLGTDDIVVSYSTITSAIHIAAYMGASNIFLCGADNGSFDGEFNMSGYYPDNSHLGMYKSFVNDIRPQTVELRDKLKEVYGCNVYSLLPFVNYSFEGHKYEC